MESDKKIEKWTSAPPVLEDIYTFEDALVVGCMLITLLNHADRVKIACLAQLVNVIAPIMTTPGGAAWRQTIFHPFAQASRFGRGTALNLKLTAPTYPDKDYGDVPVVAAAAVQDAQAGTLTIFAVNRDMKDEVMLKGNLAGFKGVQVLEMTAMHGFDLHAVNTQAQPDAVAPVKDSAAVMEDGKLKVKLQPLSWNVIRLKV
jgi:alpha-N-arabinofuranosidase